MLAKLLDLEPAFLRYEERFEGHECIAPAGGKFGDPYQHTAQIKVATLAEAQGIQFLCPACFVKNKGPVGTHYVAVGFRDRGLLDNQSSHNKEGKPSRWAVTGNDFTDISTQPSIDCGCWHGYLTNGVCT